MDSKDVSRTTAMCAYVIGPEGFPMVDCAVSKLRLPDGVLECACLPELRRAM